MSCEHDWKSIGGRQCPRLPIEYAGLTSQSVYQCAKCEVLDYGESGGPSYTDCFENECTENGMCSPCRSVLREGFLLTLKEW